MVEEKTCCGLEEELMGGVSGEVAANEYLRERHTATKCRADISLGYRLCFVDRVHS